MADIGTQALYVIRQSARVGFFLGSRLVSNRFAGPAVHLNQARDAIPSLNELLRDIRRLSARDLKNVEAGYYPMADVGHRHVFKVINDYFRDLPKVHKRRKAHRSQEVRERGDPALLERFPRYYLQNFHFQSDGWLSDASARRYDYQVEMIFLGAADAMRRQALVPMVEYVRGLEGPVAIADLACGTGRFLAQIRLALPGVHLLGIDLSPHYVARANKRMKGDLNAKALEGALEDLPLPTNSQHVISCLFTFHELPPKIRQKAAEEIARALKPGGFYIHLDSVQKGDHPPYDPLLGLFPESFHEPYYRSYVEMDLKDLFHRVGLVHKSDIRGFFSKLSVFQKPLS